MHLYPPSVSCPIHSRPDVVSSHPLHWRLLIRPKGDHCALHNGTTDLAYPACCENDSRASALAGIFLWCWLAPRRPRQRLSHGDPKKTSHRFRSSGNRPSIRGGVLQVAPPKITVRLSRRSPSSTHSHLVDVTSHTETRTPCDSWPQTEYLHRLDPPLRMLGKAFLTSYGANHGKSHSIVPSRSDVRQ